MNIKSLLPLGLGGGIVAGAIAAAFDAARPDDVLPPRTRGIPEFDARASARRHEELRDDTTSLLRAPVDAILDVAAMAPDWLPGSDTIRAFSNQRELVARSGVAALRTGIDPRAMRDLGRDAKEAASQLTREAYASRRPATPVDDGGTPWDYDNEVDAMRHASGMGMLKVRLMRDEGLDAAQADRIARSIGLGKEEQGIREGSNDPLATQMDLHNNQVGLSVVRDGRDVDGDWLTDEEVLERVRRAGAGHLVRIDDGAIVPVTRRGLDPSV